MQTGNHTNEGEIMAAEEIKIADKFASEHAMYETCGTVWCVDITKRHKIENEDHYYATDDDLHAYFQCDEVEAEFPHLKG